jgi:hypothetical protein
LLTAKVTAAAAGCPGLHGLCAAEPVPRPMPTFFCIKLAASVKPSAFREVIILPALLSAAAKRTRLQRKGGSVGCDEGDRGQRDAAFPVEASVGHIDPIYDERQPAFS